VFCALAAALVLAWWPETQHELALALDATSALTTLHGAVCECTGARLCHSRRLEGLGLQPRGVLATALAGSLGSPGWRDPG